MVNATTAQESNLNVSTTTGEGQAFMRVDRSWFIQSRRGNIKDQYFFEKKLGSGGYGAVYLAMNKQTGGFNLSTITVVASLT